MVGSQLETDTRHFEDGSLRERRLNLVGVLERAERVAPDGRYVVSRPFLDTRTGEAVPVALRCSAERLVPNVVGARFATPLRHRDRRPVDSRYRKRFEVPRIVRQHDGALFERLRRDRHIAVEGLGRRCYVPGVARGGP